MSNVYDMQHRIEFRAIPGKGQGVFSARSFKAGDLISVGVVQRILNKNEPGAAQIGEHRFVLLAGLMCRINHSCDPNCGIRPNSGGAYDLIAMRDGIRDEEITFDYAMQNYIIDFFSGPCICGAANCRGMITGWKTLPDDRKQAYEGFIAPYLLEIDEQKPPPASGQ